MTATQLFAKLDTAAHKFDGKLSAANSDLFIQQFKEICSCSNAITHRGIVYVWYTEKPIPRLKGESNVVYIGKTKQSFRERHFRYAEVEGSEMNWKKYSHIIKEFGPIRVMCAHVDDPRDKEKRMLLLYQEDHLEFPPINATG